MSISPATSLITLVTYEDGTNILYVADDAEVGSYTISFLLRDLGGISSQFSLQIMTMQIIPKANAEGSGYTTIVD